MKQEKNKFPIGEAREPALLPEEKNNSPHEERGGSGLPEDTSNLSDKIRPKGKILDFPLDKAHLLLRGGKVINVKDVKHHLKAFIEENFYWEDGELLGNYKEWFDWKEQFKKHFGGLVE